ncbi:MAG: site-2 protease family protein [Eggerthella lenta]
MIVCAVISIGFLVFIHEGGHYLAARAFGVRVTEFMLGLPGPSIGFTRARPAMASRPCPRRLREGVRHGGRPLCNRTCRRCSRRFTAAAPLTWRTWPATAASATMKHTTPWKSWWNGAASSIPPRPISTTLPRPARRARKRALKRRPRRAAGARLLRAGPSSRSGRSPCALRVRVPPAVPLAALLEALGHPWRAFS